MTETLQRHLLAATAFALAAAAWPVSAGAQPQQGAAAAGPTHGTTLVNRNGDRVGSVTLSQYPRGVFVHAQVNGLPPGWHGFHIHETGACEPDFGAAGGHFAPGGHGHGLDQTQGHAGDLPNLFVNDDGVGRMELWTDAVSLTDGPNTLFDRDGSALVVHAGPDDYVTDPAGNSGDRIACGVLRRE